MAISTQTRLSLILLCSLLSGCAIFAPSYSALDSYDNQQPINTVLSEQTGWLVYGDTEQTATGIVFYPGGKVAPEAYADFAAALNKSTGAVVVIVPMPLDLAVLGKNKGLAAQQALPQLSQWVIGGHSLGGTMAASLVYEQPEYWQGLFLLASYPQKKHNFATFDLASLSIIGDQDGLIPMNQWQATLEQLPAKGQTWLIEGGNHAYFGHYGEQDGDQPALISHQAQQSQTVKAITQWLADF